MLYVSTRNSVDTYTAYRALHEERAPDGGFYVPFHLPVFTKEELSNLREQSFGDTVAQLLNLFFGARLTGWDVECAIGRLPIKSVYMNQRFIVAEAWRNPAGTFRYVLNSLYRLLSDETATPTGWYEIAVEIAFLFGLYGTLENVTQDFDIAVATGDFSDISAALYAKSMGLPVRCIVCACNENNAVWDLINKGDFHTNLAQPKYMEHFLSKCFGVEAVLRYLEACEKKTTYYVDEVQLDFLNQNLFSAVVSTNRVGAIISSMYQTNQYQIDYDSALAYGGLQDYRSRTGISNHTLILAKQRPVE